MRSFVFVLALVASAVAPALADDPVPSPANPVAVAEAALARSRASLQCRFAFTLEEEGSADATWAEFANGAKQTLEFDPRRPIGDRWHVLRNEKKLRQDIRRQFNLGGRSDPHADLLTLTLEGDIDITNLQLREERADVWVFAFTPQATATVNPQAHVFLNALRGELWVSRQSGEITRRTLSVDAPFDAGYGRVRSANFMREYAPIEGGGAITRATTQAMSITVQGRGVDSSGKQQISAVSPICDPAEVRRIAEMELRDVKAEVSDTPPPTGTRLRDFGGTTDPGRRPRKR